jgi:FtsX-like permease family
MTFATSSTTQGFNTMRPVFGRPVLVLIGVVVVVLLVACANLAHLLIARAQTRSREFAMRLALGASRPKLIRQLLGEAWLLSIGGGIAGVALPFWITSTVVSFLNAGQPPTSALQVAPDAYVLSFSALLSIATVLLFGLAPAWYATQPDLIHDLKHESGASSLLSRAVASIARGDASLVLVFAAGLLTRTLQELATVDLGYDPRRVMALNVDPSSGGYSGERAASVLDEVLIRARDLPGVRAASVASGTPRGATLVGVPDHPLPLV